MTTVSDIITRALRKIAIVSGGEVPDGIETQDAVDALNDMAHGWRLAGVDFEWVDVAASDPMPVGQEYNEGFVYLLAGRLSPDYVAPANFDADDWFRKFQADKIVVPTSDLALGLRRMPSITDERY